jgi:TonB family protein
MGYSASQQLPFSLLPKARTPWTEFVFSTGTQAGIVAILLWLRLLAPAIVSSPEHNFRSVRLASTPAPVNHQTQPLRALPKRVDIANIDPPANVLHLPTPQPGTAAKIEEPTAPKIMIAASKLEALPVTSVPVIPRVVATNVFSTGSSAAPTTMREPEQVQTGGFGDPNGIPAKANSGKAVNIAAAGSFDLPSGAGYGNGSGGAKGARGVVASSGFGSGTAMGETARQSSLSTVQTTGFGEAGVAMPASPRARGEVSTVPVLPAEILSKPTPVYTPEARNLKIEGEVLLEVVLAASGSLHVVRVVRGLGHGLDDNAVKAAEQIHFRPASRNGQPADSTVVLHIIFQLA